MTFSASGWDDKAKKALVVGMHVQNASSPFSNSTMVFASVDLGSGKTQLANGTSQCGMLEYAVPGCQGPCQHHHPLTQPVTWASTTILSRGDLCQHHSLLTV